MNPSTDPTAAAEPTRHVASCRPLTPRQRAAVRRELASRIGAGRAATREEVTAELFGAQAAKPARG